MRRKRQRLQVSTFPFLAVLLCAMGSLILFLLVLDRRAKIVALEKARRQSLSLKLQQETERKEDLARREAEWEKRRQELHALLLAQQQHVLAQLQQVHEQEAKAKTKMLSAEDAISALLHELQKEKGALVRLQGEVQVKQMRVAQAGKEDTKSQKSLARLAGELEQMEQVLQALKLLRIKNQNKYSVVPYNGRRGENRKPVYAECIRRGCIFHPDGLRLEDEQFSPLAVRQELERRIGGAMAGGKDKSKGQKPYLFVLVRPDGLGSYYAVRSALAGLAIDFGYELIDQDWVLDFSREGNGLPKAPPVLAVAPDDMSLPAKTIKGYKATGPDNHGQLGGLGPGLAPGGGQPGTNTQVAGIGAWKRPSGSLPIPPATGLVKAGDPAGGPFPANGPASGTPGPGTSAAGQGSSIPGVGALGSSSGTAPVAGGTVGGLTGQSGQRVPAPTIGQPIGMAANAFPATGQGSRIPGAVGTPGSGGLVTGRDGPAGGPPGLGGSPTIGPPGIGGAEVSASGAGSPPGSGSGPPGSGTSSNSGLLSGTPAQGGQPNAPNSAFNTGRPIPIIEQGGSGPAGAGPFPGQSGSPPGVLAGQAPPGQGASPEAIPGGQSPGPGANSASPAAGPQPGAWRPYGINASAPQAGSGDPTAAIGIGPGSGGAGFIDHAGLGGGAPGTGGAGNSGGAGSGGAGGAGQGMGGSGGHGATGGKGDTGTGSGDFGSAADGAAGGEFGATSPPGAGVSFSDPRLSTGRRLPPTLSRLTGNRDWYIPVECRASEIVLPLSREHIPLAALVQQPATANQLVQSIRIAIARRQATVRPGEPPYRPILRYEVHRDGVRTYHAVYPLLEVLGLPEVRQNIKPAEPDVSDYYPK
jgi:hypothetical protein